jgi:hypothetical protein
VRLWTEFDREGELEEIHFEKNDLHVVQVRAFKSWTLLRRQVLEATDPVNEEIVNGERVNEKRVNGERVNGARINGAKINEVKRTRSEGEIDEGRVEASEV